MANFLNDDHLSQPPIAKIQVHPCMRTEFIYAEIAIEFKNKRRRKEKQNKIASNKTYPINGDRGQTTFTQLQLIIKIGGCTPLHNQHSFKNSPTTHDRKANNEIKIKQTIQM